MSWQAVAWALKQETGSAATKLTLLGLANYADQHGICWPTQETLASGTEQSVDTVQRRIKQLVALGLVRVERRQGARGQWAGRVYHLNMSVAEMTKPQKAVSPKKERDALPPTSPCRTENGDHAALGPTTMPQALRYKPSIEPILEPIAKTVAQAAIDRLQAFQGKHEATEVVQNRIARRLGSDGWLVLGALSDARRATLTTLERQGKLDERTLAAAALEARIAQPP